MKDIFEMTLEEFETELENWLKNSKYEYEIIDVQKVNIAKKGFRIDNGGLIQPLFYPDLLYDVVTHPKNYIASPVEEATMDNLELFIDEVLNRTPEMSVVDCDKLSSFKDIKDNIIPCLISKDKNEELLKTVPYKDFLDLAVIFKIINPDKTDGNLFSVNITNDILKSWEVSIEDLLKTALRVDDYQLEDVGEMLGMPIMVPGAPIFLCLTNELRTFGAAGMMNTKILDEAREILESDKLYIIPSSIHEVLLVADCDKFKPDEIKEMINEINNTDVSPTDILSYSLYSYDGEVVKIE